jgi:hypothetical protein
MLHNTIVNFRLKNADGGDLSKDTAYAKHAQNWNKYQKKFASRSERMRKSPRIEPVFPGKDIVTFSSNCALIGTLTNLSLGSRREDKCTSITCKLFPESDSGGLPTIYHEVYDRRCREYNNTNVTKITSDQLANFQSLVRMEIQYLASCDVEWSLDPDSENGDGSTGPQGDGSSGPRDDADSRASPNAAASSSPSSLSQALPRPSLSLLAQNQQHPSAFAAAAGSIARNGEHSLSLALCKSNNFT